MKRFEQHEIREAIDYSLNGGQAVHVFQWFPNESYPRPFRRGGTFVHLLDQDKERLISTAKRLGVNKIVVSRIGKAGQHVDLVGEPMRRAFTECDKQ